MKYKKMITSLVITLSFIFTAYAQDSTETKAPKKDKRPVRSPFESGVLIDNQTIVVPSAKTLEFVIQHRFGKLNSGTFDLAGLYAPSNMRMGFNYVIIKNVQVGIGTTKNNKLQDLNWKWSIFSQTRSGSMPIALTYFGNIEYSARDKENFGTEYKMPHRLSYFHQLILARKFHRIFSLQLTANYSHFNQIDTNSFQGAKHDNFGISLAGRVKLFSQLGIIFEYDQSLSTPEQIKPNISFGIELSTSSHAFQIFVGSFDGISYQENYVYNTNDFTKKDILLGFNITRLWNF